MTALQNYFKYSLSQWECEPNVRVKNDLKTPLTKKARVLNQNMYKMLQRIFYAIWIERLSIKS